MTSAGLDEVAEALRDTRQPDLPEGRRVLEHSAEREEEQSLRGLRCGRGALLSERPKSGT